ncbi:MAG: alpha/beta hydrolase [Pedobacter sp.]|nr:MAG: alpha/beta hydrolase [Pedobacter sp.]
MKPIYLLGGLGADERVMDYLEFPGFQKVFIPWLAPLKNETISQHAFRLSTTITEQEPTLIALSFGGILAIEIAKVLEGVRVIVISSIKTQREVPYYFRLAGKLNLHRLLPISLLKVPSPVTFWLFGVKGKAEKELLTEVLRNTDAQYLRWALHQIVRWSNRINIPGIVHIHGSSDRLLPIGFVHADRTVIGVGHLMAVTHAQEVNRLFRDILF